MTKAAFLRKLEENLSGIPREDIKRSLDYYGEMIDDRIEDGMSESEAVYAVGEPEEVAKRIICDIPLAKLMKKMVNPGRKMRAWEIVLIVLGAPIWISVLVALFAVVISFWAVFYSFIISLYAVVFSLGVCAVGGAVAALIYFASGNSLGALFLFASALVCAGLTPLLFLACNKFSKLVLLITKKTVVAFKKFFMRKESY